MRKAQKIICIVLAVLLLLSSAVSVWLYRELKAEREYRAGRYYSNWSRLLTVANEGSEVIDISSARDFYHLQNGIIHTVESDISPSFNNIEGLDTYHSSFLTTWFDSFVLDISNAKEDEADTEERLALLKEMCQGLYDICAVALNLDDENGYKATQLLDNESEIYKELEKMMKDYAEKYVPEIKKYN